MFVGRTTSLLGNDGNTRATEPWKRVLVIPTMSVGRFLLGGVRWTMAVGPCLVHLLLLCR